jgi:hypothetical protein
MIKEKAKFMVEVEMEVSDHQKNEADTIFEDRILTFQENIEGYRVLSSGANLKVLKCKLLKNV